MPEFPPVLPHGPLREVLPGLFFVTGTVKTTLGGVPRQFSRNMTVVRDGDSLTLINAVRLDDAGLAGLEELGAVRNVVKIGFHGMDDPFYADRYGARVWALAGASYESGLRVDAVLAPGGEMPFAGGSLFVFETARNQEGILFVDRGGLTAIPCDSLQNITGPDEFFDAPTVAILKESGFLHPTNVGPGWLRGAKPQPADFQRLARIPFENVLPAHGTPVLGGARDRYAARFRELFGT